MAAFAFALCLLVQADLSSSLNRVPERKAEWQTFLAGLPKERKASGEYLLRWMPENDLKTLKTDYIGEMIRLAEEARGATTWGPQIPFEVYLDGVLPYASVTEPRDSMRAEFQQKYLGVAKKAKTPGEAALAINKVLFVDYKVTYNTKRLRTDQNAKESIKQGMATCTGLSIMLVDALRAVGVPSRLAGIAAWPGRGGNHTWVEVWDKGRWHFVGAAEPDANGLNHAWFGGEAGGAIEDKPENAIWAVTYKDGGGRFPLVWRPGFPMPAENVTARYRTKSVKKPRLMVEVKKGGTRVVADVEVFDESGKSVLKGRSLGPSADINLHLTAEVKQGETYRVVVSHGGSKVTREVKAEEADTTVRLSLDSSLFSDRFSSESAVKSDAAAKLASMPFSEEGRAKLWEAFRGNPDAAMKADFDADTVRTSNRTSPYKWRMVGEKPAKGWGLVIAMHGGGGAPKAVNDREWENMFARYYADQSQVPGYIYLALRAPNDEWNGVYDDAIVPLVERLILQFVKFGGVDPDSVYACGASHGGYGGFVIGPKAPHRFAAIHAAAAAPTDGETFGENLRNLRFTWAVGETDTAYGRRERCDKFAKQWEEWRAKHGGFDGKYEMVAGRGHGIGPTENNRVSKLRPYVRDAHPTKIIWTMSDAVINRFYWLEAVPPKDGGRVEASIVGNTITLTTSGVGPVALWLPPSVDLSKPVIVVRDGKRHEFKVKASLETYAQGLEQTGDPRLSSGVRVFVPGSYEPQICADGHR